MEIDEDDMLPLQVHSSSVCSFSLKNCFVNVDLPQITG